MSAPTAGLQPPGHERGGCPCPGASSKKRVLVPGQGHKFRGAQTGLRKYPEVARKVSVGRASRVMLRASVTVEGGSPAGVTVPLAL